MRRVVLLSLAFLAVWRLPLAAAATGTEDVPVPAAVSALADSMGLPAASYRASFAADLTRLVYSPTDVKGPQLAAQLRAHARENPDAGFETVLVPVPLTAEVWSRAIFHRTTAPADLLTAILTDRHAALLCHGLAGLDDETLTFLSAHPAILTDLYEHMAPAFGTFGSTLHIHDGRVVPPGGALGLPLWETAIGVTADRVDRFVHVLYGENDGRVAYLYDTIAELDAPHAAFALGA